jgi:hypothetical protein
MQPLTLASPTARLKIPSADCGTAVWIRSWTHQLGPETGRRMSKLHGLTTAGGHQQRKELGSPLASPKSVSLSCRNSWYSSSSASGQPCAVHGQLHTITEKEGVDVVINTKRACEQVCSSTGRTPIRASGDYRYVDPKLCQPGVAENLDTRRRVVNHWHCHRLRRRKILCEDDSEECLGQR